ncbi:hypothetical protein BX667DRAFT_529799 [Coemansia mojavensis]|nr:hypothetical protein BX667DRAFT_529799 [Coemansia mojavensis]
MSANTTDHDNRGRIESGLHPLKVDERLNSAAQDHSNYHAQINILTHGDAAGTLGTRVSSSGVVWMRLGENAALQLRGLWPGQRR